MPFSLHSLERVLKTKEYIFPNLHIILSAVISSV